jgi:hypothetical protein
MNHGAIIFMVEHFLSGGAWPSRGRQVLVLGVVKYLIEKVLHPSRTEPSANQSDSFKTCKH